MLLFVYMVQASLDLSIGTRKGKYPMLKTYTKPQRLIKHTKISDSIVPLIFCKFFLRHLPEWSKPRYLKAETLQVPQKVPPMLVSYLLWRIHILVYSWTGSSTSKIYLCLEDNRSSFSRVSLKFKTKDTHL